MRLHALGCCSCEPRLPWRSALSVFRFGVYASQTLLILKFCTLAAPWPHLKHLAYARKQYIIMVINGLYEQRQISDRASE